MKIQQGSILPFIASIACGIIVIGGIKSSGDIIAPFLMMIFLSVLCLPYYVWLKRRMKSGYAIIVFFLTLCLSLFGLLGLLTVSAMSLVGKLGNYQERVVTNAQELQTQLASLGIAQESIEDAFYQLFRFGSSLTVSFISGLATTVMGIFLTIMGITFIVLESDQFSKRLAHTFGEKSPQLRDLSEFRNSLISYFLARVNVNLFTALGVSIPLFLMNIEFVILWGLMAFIFSFIPYVGFVVALIPPTLLAFGQYGIWGAVAVILIYTIVNQIAENIVAPKTVGNKVNISPAVVFFSVFFFMWLLGSLGALLAAPLTVLLIMILKKFPETRWLGNLFTKTTTPTKQLS